MGDEGAGASDTHEPATEASWRRPQLLTGYAVIGLLAIGAAIAIAVLSSAASSDESGDPHINLDSGATNGVAPDTRVGSEPPPLPDKSLKEAARAAGCELRLRLPDEGHVHLPPTAPEPRYNTNPPTSGPHIEDPYQQADGAYSETPRPSAVIHALEHGRLAIQYGPDLPERARLELIGLFDTMYGGTLLFPNPNMPYVVAATTWTNLIGCASYHRAPTLAAIEIFGRGTWGRFGGEPVLGLKPAAPTPRSP